MESNGHLKALAAFLEVDEDDLEEVSYHHYGLPMFTTGTKEWAVGTDEQADEATKTDIEEGVWSFNADFILSHSSVENYNDRVLESIKSTQEKLCEGANGLLKAMIKDFDKFVKDAISLDGRGHFLSGYDGDENEHEVDGTYYFIY